MPKAHWRSGLTTILAGVSLTAAFAAVGFLAAFGREQFLGIHLTDWTVQTLTLLAGRFAADSFFMALDYVVSGHTAIVVLSFVVIASLLVLSRRRRFPQWIRAAAESLIAAALAIYLLSAIVRFEAPTVVMRGWVIAPSVESPVEKAICDLSPLKNCPGISTPGPGITRLQHYSRSSLELKNVENPGLLLLESSSPNAAALLKDYNFKNPLPRAAAQRLLYQKYTSLELISLLSLLFVGFFCKLPEATAWCDVLMILRSALAVVAVVSAAMIPYVYGKLIDPALFPNAALAYTEDQPKSIQMNGSNAVNVPGGDPILNSGRFPVISQSDRSIFILWIQQGTGISKLIEVPRGNIVSINYVGDVDALEKITDCRRGDKPLDCQ